MNRTVDPDRMLRPYELARGRTEVRGTWAAVQYVQAVVTDTAGWDEEYAELLALTAVPVSVVEVCARSSLPNVVAGLMLADLIDAGAVRARGPVNLEDTKAMVALLERVVVGIREL